MSPQPPLIFDRPAIARARARAERRDREPFLIRVAAEGLATRVAPINRRFHRAVDIEPFHAGVSARKGLADSWSTARFDETERLAPEGAGFELATSVLGLHFVNDLPGALIQIGRLLVPDGVFAAALFGGSTLHELRSSLTSAESAVTGGGAPHVAPFADVRDVGNLLQRACFALTVADVDRTTVRYASFDRLVDDLRANAQTNVLVTRSKRSISKRVRDETIAHYKRHFSEPDGRLRATFDIIYFVAFAPASSQPKALRPGSATHRLAKALGSEEIALRDFPKADSDQM